MRGEIVNEETLAVDWIDQVGPGGDFLALEHTRDHFREDWYPTLFNRKNYDGWVSQGKPTLRDRSKEVITRILEDHQPDPLPKEISEALQAVIDGVISKS
jgi:trimethylamine--corrinoid protein Co-methyltransferase